MMPEPKQSSQTRPLSPEVQMLRLTSGHLVAQAIHVFAELSIADLLKDGPKTSDEIAQATNANPTVLYRVMRFLGAFDVVSEELEGNFSLTRLGRTLCRHPTSVIRDNTLLVTSPNYWTAIGNMLHAVKTGENAFHQASGRDYFDCLSADPAASAVFNAAMNSSSHLGISAILAAYDFSGLREIVDVAGGRGALITGILKKHSSVRGILFDSTQAIDDLELDATLDGRLAKARGSFFETIPPGANAYLMRRILHDWSDEKAVEILRQCRRAMTPDSKLLLIELASPDNKESGRDWATMDLIMTLVLSGKERTVSEFEKILQAAGLTLARTIRTHSPYWIIEAIPSLMQ